jgi:F-type H+-transporting ATPase subunit epsilon
MFHCSIITPEKVLIDTEVTSVTLPTINGEITVLSHHARLVTQLSAGILTIRMPSREETMAIDGGFVEMGSKTLTILADFATLADDVNTLKAEEARKRAETAMKEKKSLADFTQAEAEFKRALLELKVAGRKSRTH